MLRLQRRKEAENNSAFVRVGESKLTVNPSKQTAKGRMRMYQPAQNPARGQPQKMRPRNQTNDQMGLPPPVPSPPPAAIFRAVRKLECKLVNI